MIHLDACFLIQASAPGNGAQVKLQNWKANGEVFAISSVAWGEFLCGPSGAAITSDLEQSWKTLIAGGIIPLDASLASKAAIFFNKTGRRSRSFQDCIVAATAVDAAAPLATTNTADFLPFTALGLQLI